MRKIFPLPCSILNKSTDPCAAHPSLEGGRTPLLSGELVRARGLFRQGISCFCLHESVLKGSLSSLAGLYHFMLNFRGPSAPLLLTPASDLRGTYSISMLCLLLPLPLLQRKSRTRQKRTTPKKEMKPMVVAMISVFIIKWERDCCSCSIGSVVVGLVGDKRQGFVGLVGPVW